VPDASSAKVTVVRATTGAVFAVLSGNGLSSPFSVAFDGERVLVAGNHLSVWRAADLSPLGYVDISAQAQGQIVGVCSDGTNFWVSILGSGQLARF
jgi:hypothetical protein